MEDAERYRHLRNMMKYNEFHKGGQKEDRTTAEILEIATALEDGALITCVTWLWPNMRLSITIDNRPYELVRDVMLAVTNKDGYEFHLKPFDIGGLTRIKDGPARNSKDMNMVDIIESFGLDDKKIINPEPPTPGIWTGWFLMSYRGPRQDE